MYRPNIACPTYIFRESAPTKLPEILQQVSALGFDGVELCGFFGWSPDEVDRMLKENNLKPAGDNMPIYDIMENMEDIVEQHRKLGFFSFTAGNFREEHLPGGEYFGEAVEWMKKLGAACKEAGIRYLYHNHAKEFQTPAGEGKNQMDVILETLPADVLGFQPDLGWMQIGGADPIAYLKKYVNRCPMIHVKDFFATDQKLIGDPFDLEGKRGSEERGLFEFRPTGYGISNIPSQMPYIKACHPTWVVTCQDTHYDRDAFGDLAMGLAYMNKLFAIHQ